MNFHLFNESFVKDAHANSDIQKVMICDGKGERHCARVSHSNEITRFSPAYLQLLVCCDQYSTFQI